MTAAIGSASAADIAASSRSRAANASTRSPRSDSCRLAARISSRTRADRHLLPVPQRVAAALDDDVGRTLHAGEVRLAAGSPPVSHSGRSWNVAMNLYSESNGTSARRGSGVAGLLGVDAHLRGQHDEGRLGRVADDRPVVADGGVACTASGPRARRWKSGSVAAGHAEDRRRSSGSRRLRSVNHSPPASIVVAVIAFIVSVPVLSLLMTVVPPRVSTSVSDLTTAFDSARRRAPDDSIACTNVGRPVGIAEIAVETHSSSRVCDVLAAGDADDGDHRHGRARRGGRTPWSCRRAPAAAANASAWSPSPCRRSGPSAVAWPVAVDHERRRAAGDLGVLEDQVRPVAERDLAARAGWWRPWPPARSRR